MSNSIKLRPIGSQGLQAGSIGFGAMGLTFAYGPPTEDEHSVGKWQLCNLEHLLFAYITFSLSIQFYMVVIHHHNF